MSSNSIPSSDTTWNRKQAIMAPIQPRKETEDFDNVSLSGNESDASYDMADDSFKIPRKNENNVSTPVSEASNIDTKGKDKANDDMLRSSNADLGVSTSGLDDAEIQESSREDEDQAFGGEGKDEEQFYDMYSDQRLDHLRGKLTDEVRSLFALLDSLVGLEMSHRQPLGTSLLQHSRAIALMFGDDIPGLEDQLQDNLTSYSNLSEQWTKLWNVKEEFKLGFEKESQARRQLEILHQQAVQSTLTLSTQYQKEIQARQELEGTHKRTVLASSGMEEAYRSEKNQKLALVHAIKKLQTSKIGLMGDSKRYEAEIASYKKKMQELENENQQERLAKEGLKIRLHKEFTEHERAVRFEQREKKHLAWNNEQLNNVRQALYDEVNSAKTSYFEAIEAVKAERKAKDLAIAEKKKFESENVQLKFSLQEVKTQYTLMADSERAQRERTQAENDKLRKSCANMKDLARAQEHQYALVLKQEKQARDSVIRSNNTLREDLATVEDREELLLKEVAEFKRAMTDVTKEQIAEENEHKSIVGNLEKKLTSSNKSDESLQKCIANLVVNDCKRTDTIEELNTKLTEANEELRDMQKLRDILRRSTKNVEHEWITRLLDQRQASNNKFVALRQELSNEKKVSQKVSKNCKYFGKELLRTFRTCSGLVAEKMDLTTRIVLLENKLAEASKFSQTVHDTVTSLFNDASQVPGMVEMVKSTFDAHSQKNDGEAGDAEREMINYMEEMVIYCCNKTVSLDNHYRKGLKPLLSPAKDGEDSSSSASSEKAKYEAASTITQQCMNQENALKLLQTEHASTTTALKAATQTNMQLTASHAAALNELTERRAQIVEFEALQSKLELNEARALAQMNQFKTEVRCLQDLHSSDVEKIKEIETKLHNV